MIDKYRLPIILILTGLVISISVYLFSINRISIKHFLLKNNDNPDVLTLQDVEEPLPVYPDFIQIKNDKEVQNLGTVYRIDYESNKSIPELSSWFLEQLPKNNWKIDTVPADKEDESVQLIYAVTTNQLVHVSLVKDTESSKTKINYQVISRRILHVEEGEEEGE